MELNVVTKGLHHISEFMAWREGVYLAATGLRLPWRIPSRGEYFDRWNEFVKPLKLGPPVCVAQSTGSGRHRPLRSWVQYL